MALQKTDTTTHQALLVLLKSWVTLCQGSLALFIGTLFLSESVAATPKPLTPQQKSQDVVEEKHSRDRFCHFTQIPISECFALGCDGREAFAKHGRRAYRLRHRMISEVEGEAFAQKYLGVKDTTPSPSMPANALGQEVY